MPESISPHTPSLQEKLLQMIFGDEAMSRYAIRRINDKEEFQSAQNRFSEAGGGLDAPIPGGNPEVSTPRDALVGAMIGLGGAGIPPSISRAGQTTPVKPPASPRRSRQGSIKPNDDGYIGQLRDKVEGNLFRETSIERLHDLLPSNRFSDMTLDNFHMATSRNLALGQGKNKGVLVELEPSALQGKINRSKPGLRMLPGGEGEVIGRYNNQRAYQDAVRAFTVNKDAKGARGETHRLRSLLPQLEAKGWKKTENSDGSITYEKP